jgi:hypothetical protein
MVAKIIAVDDFGFEKIERISAAELLQTTEHSKY